MINPKEKAKELFLKFKPHSDGGDMNSSAAKEFALIAADEVRECLGNLNGSFPVGVVYYWAEVKEEIRKLI